MSDYYSVNTSETVTVTATTVHSAQPSAIASSDLYFALLDAKIAESLSLTNEHFRTCKKWRFLAVSILEEVVLPCVS